MQSSRHQAPLLLGALLLVLAPSGARGQDVEMLAERYGTRPPEAYYRELARNPDAYQFSRGRAARQRMGAAAAGALTDGEAATGPSLALGPRDGPVVGSFAVPVLLGLFSDTPGDGPYGDGTVQAAYFGETADLLRSFHPTAPGTVRNYYDEASGGQVDLDGRVQAWRRVALTKDQVTRGDGALSSTRTGTGGIGDFVRQLVQAQPTTLDWGLFDNDGPDGFPNSGDDDGYVDALAVIHPTRGAECNGSLSNVWSHKWSLSEALGTTVATPTPGANGGFVRVDDYFVQPVLSCDGSNLNEIGIFTHEVGHAFGLPDLYDVRGGTGHAGVGSWDLMSTGAWGCDNASPESPCHMGAWTKAMLGWVDVVPLEGGLDHGALTLSPVQVGRTVYRVDAQDGSGEYFLLENRARTGFDGALLAEGLLVWQVDPVRVSSRWGSNTVNGSDTPGVRLRQADGRDDLGTVGGGRGDAGDPFPGATGNVAFHAGSSPASTSYPGSATGVTLVDIQRSGQDLAFRLLTRFASVSLTAEGSAGTVGLFSVDGSSPRPSGTSFSFAPFETRTVEAEPGELIEPGIRRPFSRWAVDGSRTRAREVTAFLGDSTLTAIYEGREMQVSVELEGGSEGVIPAQVESFPASDDLWFREGTEVSLEVVPKAGFDFLSWTGSLDGSPNPAFVTLDVPVFAGARLQTTYGVPDVVLRPVATVPQDLELDVRNATDPVSWSVLEGSLPEGMMLRSGGRLTGAPLETGTFRVTVQVRDGIGLTADGVVTLEVAEPALEVERAAAPFLLSTQALTGAEEAFLDRRGNGDGIYDLGDFRAWALRGSGAVGSEAARATAPAAPSPAEDTEGPRRRDAARPADALRRAGSGRAAAARSESEPTHT